MSPDDPRHGTNAGYLTHQREQETPCPACADARYRFRKRVLGDKLRGERLLYTADEVRVVLEPWLAMGVTVAAIASAAGMEGQRSSQIHTSIRLGRDVRRSTYRRLLAVTENDLAPTAKVYGDLTRHRVNSLMAAGHPLATMPINSCGQWRKRRHVSVATARTMRDYYAAHEHIMGPNAHTQARARNAGHKPPFAWDDPGTLAWPLGTRQQRATSLYGDEEAVDVDPVVVMRLLEGQRVTSNRAEKEAAMARWVADGGSRAELARWHGWKAERYTTGLRVVQGGAA